MNVSKTVLGALASPPIALLIAVVLLSAGLRSRLLRSRLGGVAAGLAGAALLVLALADPTLRVRALDARGLPVLLLAVLAVAMVGWALTRDRERTPGAPARRDAPLPATVAAAVAVMAVVVVAMADDPPLDVPADPAGAAGASPAWFLIPFAQAARVLDPALAWIVLPLVLLAALVAVPFLDQGDEPTAGVRGFGLFAFLIVFLMPMVIGGLLPERPLPPGAAPLAVRFWEDLLDQLPRSAFVRELPALLLTAIAFVFLPWFLPRWKPTRNVFGRLRQRLGTPRYVLATTLAVLLVAVPVTVWARWWLAIG